MGQPRPSLDVSLRVIGSSSYKLDTRAQVCYTSYMVAYRPRTAACGYKLICDGEVWLAHGLTELAECLVEAYRDGRTNVHAEARVTWTQDRPLTEAEQLSLITRAKEALT